jgi:hypothetical protein
MNIMAKRRPEDAATEREHREEAQRLRQLPRTTQREIIALHRSVATDKGVPPVDRLAARRRVNTLERLLNLRRKKPRK